MKVPLYQVNQLHRANLMRQCRVNERDTFSVTRTRHEAVGTTVVSRRDSKINDVNRMIFYEAFSTLSDTFILKSAA